MTTRKPQKKTIPQPPVKNYAYLKNLDLKGWYAEITRLHQLSFEHNLGLHKDDPNIVITPAGDIVQLGVPIVQFVPPDPSGFKILPFRLPALVIDANAPDAVIRKELKRTLKEIRKKLPAPVAKRGRYDLNTQFDGATFAKWRNDKIVEFADLLAWRADLSSSDQAFWQEYELGKVLGYADRAVKRDCKTTLKKALASLPALAAQVALITPVLPAAQ